MELNVNEPLMKHRYCYQITSEIGLRLRSMIRREVTCLLSLWCVTSPPVANLADFRLPVYCPFGVRCVGGKTII